jgi:hypothetical protein
MELSRVLVDEMFTGYIYVVESSRGHDVHSQYRAQTPRTSSRQRIAFVDFHVLRGTYLRIGEA